jgi:hypothetical protein
MGHTQPISIGHWFALGLGALAFSYALSALSHSFGEETAYADLPVLSFLLLQLVGTGLIIYFSTRFAKASEPIQGHRVITLIFLIGLGARLMHLGGVPILEDDYQRYLWDGALLAHGLSPYIYAPLSFLKAEVDALAYWDLAETAWPVIERINHPEYRTVYPPVAQAAFAASYWISPLSLDGWRIVLLLCEIVVFTLLIAVLKAAGKNQLWAALYWWHPLVIKEVANSGHLEPILMVFVLAALWAAMTGRARTAAVFLALGFGVKIWPVLLLAPVLWAVRRNRVLAVQSALIFAAGAALMM